MRHSASMSELKENSIRVDSYLINVIYVSQFEHIFVFFNTFAIQGTDEFIL